MAELIESNPYYYLNSSHRNAWAEGFEAGQKSTLLPAPLSVTGRWWQVQNGNIYFINKKDYEPYEQTTNSAIGCQWLSEEITIGFE